jgi:hypothetical protein
MLSLCAAAYISLIHAAHSWESMVLSILPNTTRKCLVFEDLRVSTQGHICSLPLLLPGWQPDLGGLCDLVLGFARDVVWDQEQPCFMGVAQVWVCVCFVLVVGWVYVCVVVWGACSLEHASIPVNRVHAYIYSP